MNKDLLVYSLDRASSAGVKQIGGKALSLAKLIRAGFAVPPGFVVTTKAYQLFNGKALGKELEQQLLAAFDELGAQQVAVRSSAVAEDSSGASWAGQFETYLNVERGELLQRVQDCWHSAKSQRVNAYAAQQSVATNRAVAVVVQTMVASEIAGVMFTCNPVDQNRQEIIIEAVQGLGESLVQGTVTPDHVRLNKRTKRVVEQYLSQDQPLLDPKQLEELAHLATSIESLYDQPMDIEWAYAADKLYVLQARPITTLDEGH